jgi:diguanylate cyclase (GGDEF)-like protein
MEPKFSWLCPTLRDRERFLDMQEQLGLARAVTIVMGAVVGIAIAVSVGSTWAVVAVTGAMIAIAVIGGWRLERRQRPELWIFVSTVVNIQVMLAARFSTRGLAVGAPVSALLIVATTVGADPGYVTSNPEVLIVPLALVVCIAVYMGPLVVSDIRHRSESTLDQLTGLLNRRGLEARFAEVAEQAAPTGQAVSVVVADIDHFKRINDDHGHAVGDAVLRAIADEMRSHLRTFELLYRLGGEEFLLLLPGADGDDATAVAEALRAAIENLHPEGLAVECSFGVATARDGDVVFGPLVTAADDALYEAKRHGRNRVERHEWGLNVVGTPLRPHSMA